MLRHIVMLTFKDRQKVTEISEQFKSMLIALEESVPELIRMEVGLNVSTKASAYDLVLTADFADENALDKYRVHPEHVQVLEFMRAVVEKVAVVDYEV